MILSESSFLLPSPPLSLSPSALLSYSPGPEVILSNSVVTMKVFDPPVRIQSVFDCTQHNWFENCEQAQSTRSPIDEGRGHLASISCIEGRYLANLASPTRLLAEETYAH
jgi:hypothetical protein